MNITANRWSGMGDYRNGLVRAKVVGEVKYASIGNLAFCSTGANKRFIVTSRVESLRSSRVSIKKLISVIDDKIAEHAK